jgi:putative ABC transport system permease protein
MRFLRLITANLWRNRRRTILTLLSITLALFLFGALRSVVTTLDKAATIGSEARVISRNAISLVFPLPMSYREKLQAIPGVRSVSWQNWFGGVYIDERNFFPQFGIDADSFFPMYPEYTIPPDQLQAFKQERTAVIVGPKLVRRYGWKVGQDVTLKGTIYPGEWKFTVRGVYEVSDPSFGEDVFYFHYDYLDEGTGRQAQPGVFVLELADPSAAATVCRAVDQYFVNSTTATKTETERAFQAGFVGMWGNINFLLTAIGTAVFFAILLVAANTMMMAARERTREVAVLKTLGYPERILFGMVIGEALLISTLGGLIGILGAKTLFGVTKFDANGMLPGFTVTWATVLVAVTLSIGIGLLSGLIPALQAARLPVVTALRKLV